MEKVKEGLYDLVILDVGLPDTDGRELVPSDAQAGREMPDPDADGP
jgi:DNA-binding response OmpR family regulator